MKYKIKQNIRQHIITFIFLLVLSLTAMFILFQADLHEEPVPVRVVPGIVILKEGETMPFASNMATIRLINSTVGFPNCADCMETALLEVVKGNESKTLSFRFGGIAGFHDDTAYAFDTKFIMRELLDDSVTIEYTKETPNL